MKIVQYDVVLLFCKKGVCTFQTLGKNIHFVMSGKIISCSLYNWF